MPLTFNFGEENRPELFEGKPKTPVTLLSGFLGAGKTSLLKHLLENQEGVRIGVVVNDVAAVNIDAQLVKRYEKGLVEVAELQNGCVCCSSADDLFSAVQSIVMRSRDHAFEHIVVELSGVGEPEAVKRNWAIGLECAMPVALRTEVKQVITVVDASTFGKDWLDTRQAQQRNEEVHGDKHDDKNMVRFENVGQLLAEQVEWADVIVVNKTDISSAEEIDTTVDVITALNANAPLHYASFGSVSPKAVLPAVPKGLRVLEAGQGDGYTWLQTAATMTVRLRIPASIKGRDIDCKVTKQTLRLGLRGQPAPSAAEGRLCGEVKNVADAMFEIEGCGPSRCVVVTLEKRRAVMWAGLWECSPDIDTSQTCGTVNDVPVDVQADSSHTCLDPRHQRRHLTPACSRAGERFGIQTFVFQRRRPFSASRLGELLRSWPTPRKDIFALADLAQREDMPEESDAALRPVLRSKGFCWVDAEPLKQHIWAHAGKTLVVKAADWWWASLDQEQLKFKLTYPGVEAEYNMVHKQKWDTEFGDRRQELVFIGGPRMKERDIVLRLEACLLSDGELAAFLESSRQLRVPDDDFHVNGLLKNLGATQEQIAEINARGEQRGEEERLRRKADREDTDALRSLGVGCDLEPTDHFEEAFEAID